MLKSVRAYSRHLNNQSINHSLATEREIDAGEQRLFLSGSCSIRQ